jgi:hypothetical protein
MDGHGSPSPMRVPSTSRSGRSPPADRRATRVRDCLAWGWQPSKSPKWPTLAYLTLRSRAWSNQARRSGARLMAHQLYLIRYGRLGSNRHRGRKSGWHR